MAEDIEVKIVVDDSEIIQSFSNIADQAENLDGTISNVSENISEGLESGPVDNFAESIHVLVSQNIENFGVAADYLQGLVHFVICSSFCPAVSRLVRAYPRTWGPTERPSSRE